MVNVGVRNQEMGMQILDNVLTVTDSGVSLMNVYLNKTVVLLLPHTKD